MSALGVVMPAHFFRSYLIDRSHCTLIYLGEHDKVPHVMHKKKAVEAATYRLQMQSNILSVPVTGVELFGHGTKTVLTLSAEILLSYRQFLERELLRDDIRSASAWAFRPHVTINSHGQRDLPLIPEWMNQVPEKVYLDKPVLWWASPDGAE